VFPYHLRQGPKFGPVAGSGRCARPLRHPVRGRLRAGLENKASTIPSRNECRMGEALTVVTPRLRWSGYRLLSGLWTQTAGPYSVALKFFPSVDA
jgi:hypothetical protein